MSCQPSPFLHAAVQREKLISLPLARTRDVAGASLPADMWERWDKLKAQVGWWGKETGSG